MRDLIRRQDAIDAIPQTSVDAFENCRNCELLDRAQVVTILGSLPSAETPTVSEKHQLSAETSTNTPTDLISRQGVLAKIRTRLQDWAAYGNEEYRRGLYACEDIITSFPSAEPREYGVLCALADRECPFQGKEYAWCLTCPHISEEDRDLVKKAVAEPKTGKCETCKRSSDYLWSKGEDGTRCPIEEHYVLPKNGYCHLYE